MQNSAYIGKFFAVSLVFLLSFTTVQAAPEVGAKMPEFELQALDGKFYGTKNAQGKVTILSFLGHSCEPCVSAGPFIESQIWEQVRTKPNVQMMGLDVWNGNPAQLTLFKSVTNATYPLLRQAAFDGADYAGAVLEDLVVLDQDLTVRLVIDGAALTDHGRVVEMVDALLNTVPIVSLSTRSLYYGLSMNVGETKEITFEVENVGPGSLEITGFTTSVQDVSMMPPTLNVGPFEKQSVTITFAPKAPGTYGGDVFLQHSNNNVQTLSLPLRELTVEGQVFPSIGLTQESLDFGQTELNKTTEKVITIANSGLGTLNVTGLQTEMTDLSFSETQFTVPAGGSKDITITYNPTAEGTLSGAITVLSDDPDKGSLNIALAGSAIFIPADPRADFNGSGSVDFPDFLSFVQAFGTTDTTFDLNNNGQVDFPDFLTFVQSFGKSVN